jgi:hypothetical protein
MTELRNHYNRHILPEVRKAVEAFKAEMPEDWQRERRLEYLTTRQGEIEAELREIERRYVEAANQDGAYIERGLIASRIDILEKALHQVAGEIRSLKNGTAAKQDGITPDMIGRAREFPIENLVEVHRGKTLCIFHDDHHPSMGIKDNRFYCFSCGAKGDVIEYAMKRDSLTFPAAVRFLCGA